MRKKVLITGSNGLLGQKLIHLLSSRNDLELHACSKGNNRITTVKNFQYKNLDIVNKSALENYLKEILPEVVINTAAITNVDSCEIEQELCWAVNVIAVENMISCLEQLQNVNYQPHFIHLSTDFVFDGENGPYSENDAPNPLSFYAKSKFESEKIVIKSQLKWSIARTIIVYGVAEEMSRTNIVLWAKSALEKGETIKIVDDQFRMPTLAEDLAVGCTIIMDKNATGIFHLSGKDFMSVLEMVNRIANYFKLNNQLIQAIKTNSLSQAAKRPPKTGFVLDKANKELNYNPHSFEEGLAIVAKQLTEK